MAPFAGERTSGDERRQDELDLRGIFPSDDIDEQLNKSRVDRANEPSFSGHEQNRFFLRTGDRFYRSDLTSGLASDLDGRSVVAADLNRDGAPALVLRHLQPPHFQIFDNRVTTEATFLEIALRGRASNVDAIGANVRVTSGPKCGAIRRA